MGGIVSDRATQLWQANPKVNTLAQSGTQNNGSFGSIIRVSGNGTDLFDNSLVNRAKRKMITQKMVLALIDVAKEKKDDDRVQAYWNAYHCQTKILSSENKLYGNYCKNRFCTICCAIRKADIINRYYPTLISWENPHFVTLTVKAVKAEKLDRWIYGMFRAFELIINRCKKRYQRNKGIKLIGIKSLECNFNPQTKSYNPHLHIIVPSKEIAELLKKEWMIQWTSKHTYHKAQHIRKVDDLERDLIEIIKYGSKIFTEPDVRKKSMQAFPPMIYAYALDNILSAMKGKRIFDRFGFNLPSQSIKKPDDKFIQDYKEWLFLTSATDWINPETGECLTGYLQPIQLSYLLNECINTETY